MPKTVSVKLLTLNLAGERFVSEKLCWADRTLTKSRANCCSSSCFLWMINVEDHLGHFLSGMKNRGHTTSLNEIGDYADHI